MALLKTIFSVLLCGLVAACASTPSDKLLSNLDMDALSRVASRSVESELDVDLSDVSWEFADTYRLSRLMYKPIYDEYRLTISDPYFARFLSSAMASVSADDIFGLYKHNLKTVFISPGHLQEAYSEISEDTAVAREIFLALLIHEYIHAADMAGMDASLAGDEYVPGQSEVLGVLMEGHAEYLSEQICKKLGCSKGYTLLERGSGRKVKFKTENERYLAALHNNDVNFQYRTGKKYVARHYRETGESPVPDRRSELPDSTMLVLYPDNERLRESRFTSAAQLIDALGTTKAVFPHEQYIHMSGVYTPLRIAALLKQLSGTGLPEQPRPLFHQAAVLKLKEVNEDKSYELTDSDNAAIFVLLETGSAESAEHVYSWLCDGRSGGPSGGMSESPVGEEYTGEVRRCTDERGTRKMISVAQFGGYLLIAHSDAHSIESEKLREVPGLLQDHLQKIGREVH